SFGEARTAYTQLAGQHPRVPGYRLRLGNILTHLAELHSRRARDDLALADGEAARDLYAPLAEAYPDQPDTASPLARILHNPAVLLARGGLREGARSSLRRGVDWQRRALDRAPQMSQYRRWLAGHYSFLAMLECHSGRPDAAVDALTRRLELWPDDANELYGA